MKPSLRIAVVGPESSGKTTFSTMLAQYLQAQGIRAKYVEEYARAYYDNRPYEPTLLQVEEITLGQCALEDAVAKEAEVLICDTTPLTCKIWAEVGFGRLTPTIIRCCRERRYDYTFLASPDIPWEPDPLRGFRHGRGWLFDLNHLELQAKNVSYTTLSGDEQQRLCAALQILRTIWPAELPKI